jgi:multiple sugar transport system permease protein
MVAARRWGTKAALLLATGIMLLPLWTMLVVAAAPDDGDLSGVRPHGFALLSNANQVLSDGVFPRYILNSVIVAGVAALLDVACSAAAGYALARLRFPGRRLLFAAVILTLSLSPAVLLIPVFLIVKWFGWLNSFPGLIAPSAVSALGVFLVRQFALGIPEQMLHAARVDGVGEVRIFFGIVVPLLRPALLTLLLLQFLAQWDNLIWPLVVASDQSLWTVPVGLSSFQGEHGFNFHLMTTAALLSMVPPMALFAALQRYYVSGLTLGSVKG